ncbi:Calponin-2, partial [Saguinus oedipus]
MSSTQFNKGPSYRLSAKVMNQLLSKCAPGTHQPIRRPQLPEGPDGISLCTLISKLQPGSVPKINRSMQNWYQLENLSNFIKA